MRKIIIIAWALYGFAFRTYSQEKEMNIDRPDQTEETYIMGKGQFQMETGGLYNKFDTGQNAWVSRTMIRYGISKIFEVGVLIEQGRERNRYIQETVQNTYPLAVRIKAAIA